jgi:uncharacterized protein involved in exopolysaccharide biosynthesis
MQQTDFNLLDIITVIKQQLKQIVLFVFVSLVVTIIILFLIPKYYKSAAIVVAANPALADKARLFNNNIQGLYSNFGSGDDLDRIDGLANLDTTFKLVVDEFKLADYYKLKDADIALRRRKAVLNLREDINLQKTDLNQFKIIVTTKHKQLSANIANRMVTIVQQMEESIWQKNYQTSLDKINVSINDLEKEVTSINEFLRHAEITADAALTYTNKREALLQQLKQYYTAANEFKLAISNNAPALYIIENATPAAKHDKPKKPDVLIAALIISFVFGCLIALLYSRKRNA